MTVMNKTECLICYDEKEKEMFVVVEEEMIDICIHFSKTCKKCLESLPKFECPYCRQSWNLYMNRLGFVSPIRRLPFIFENIYLWIGICENDVELIHHLRIYWNVDVTVERPFLEVSYLLTGKDDEDIARAFQWWNEHPHRSIMKETFLQCNNIQFIDSSNTYVYVPTTSL